MKRITLWFLSTVSAVVLLFGYHTSTSSPLATASGSVGPAPTGTTTSGGAGSAGGGGGSGAATGTRATQRSAAGTAPKVSTTPTTVTGGVAQTQWGPVQVQLTVSGGKVTAVDVLQQPSGSSTDDQINSYALPVLVQETLKAQSARIDMVSGATVTSGGYLQSLQSALDQAQL
jgi:uncharacterized protein with FMN-binding domain